MPQEAVKVKIKRAEHGRDLALPRYMTAGSSGMDLCAAVEGELILDPGRMTLVPTGLSVAVPSGYELQVRPRSGLAAKSGIGILNAPGTIDSDYRGEIMVILINLGTEEFVIKRGDRIAQLVLCPVARAVLEESSDLPQSDRGGGGFGHTG